MAKISIVMATYNRRQLLINSLHSIEYYNKDRDIEVIVVDDNSDDAEKINDIQDLFTIPIHVIRIEKEEKNWMCCCMPFNIGFSLASGDIIIIQNPENFHVGDIVGYAIDNLKDGLFFSFALYSMNQKDSENLYKKTVLLNSCSESDVRKAVGRFIGKKDNWTDGDTCWYNHSVYNPAAHHLISAITRNDLEDMHGFDERYGKGFAYDDFEFRVRLKRKGIVTKIIDSPFAIHQRHELAAYTKNKVEHNRNGRLFNFVTLKEKSYRSPENVFYAPKKKTKAEAIKIDTCHISGDKDSFLYLDLGDVPLVNNLCLTRDESLSCDKFPLAIQQFRKSKLSCLTEIVNKDRLFLNYVYQSGVNKPFLPHCSEMYLYLENNVSLKSGDLVIDVGGNDGTLLLQFRELAPTLDYLNVDASSSFIDINKKSGINYINDFFDKQFHYKRKAKLITSTNVFQHTLPIRSFVKGIYNNLSSDGVWCLEFPYLLTTLLNDNYDQVYHEHIYYYLLGNIIDLLKKEKMKVINASFHNIHSGTLRVLSVKESDERIPDHSVNSFLSLEATLTEEYYVQWGERTLLKIEKFKNFIKSLHKQGASIACFGAAAKGCVFLNTCVIDYTTIKYIVDDTPFKQGKFVPGTGLEVVGRERLRTDKIDYIIILAHNFKDYIISSLQKEYNGKFIVMFPDVKII